MTEPTGQLVTLLARLTDQQLARLTPEERQTIGARLLYEAGRIERDLGRLEGEERADRIDRWTLISGGLGIAGYVGSVVDIHITGGASPLGWFALALAWGGLLVAAAQEDARRRRAVARGRGLAALEEQLRALRAIVDRL